MSAVEIAAMASAEEAQPTAATPKDGPPLAAPIETPATDAAAPASEVDKQPQSERPGGHKRKMALFMAYVGAGYMVRLIL